MTWKVKNDLVTATINGQQNVVVQVSWVYQVTDQGVTINMNGKTDLPYNASTPFIQYGELTEQDVVGWVKSELGSDAVAFYENKANEILALHLNDPNRTGTVFECWSKYVAAQEQSAPWAQ